jgi:uncharacterized protein Yka (UPF0111/DUF47 family)
VAMDEATKLLLESINDNVKSLKEDMKEDMKTLQADVKENNKIINEIKKDYVTKKDCNHNVEKIEKRENDNKNLSYKKLALMISGVSGCIYGLIELVKQLKG